VRFYATVIPVWSRKAGSVSLHGVVPVDRQPGERRRHVPNSRILAEADCDYLSEHDVILTKWNSAPVPGLLVAANAKVEAEMSRNPLQHSICTQDSPECQHSPEAIALPIKAGLTKSKARTWTMSYLGYH